MVLESSVWSQELTASCSVLHAQLKKCEIDQLVASLLCHCLFKKSTGCTAARREDHMPATHIFHKNPCSWQPVCWGLFYLASKSSSWHRSPLFRGIVDPGTRAPGCWIDQRNREEGRGLHAPSGSELSAGAQVQTSPGIPSVSEEARDSCRCTCAYSQGLSERG